MAFKEMADLDATTTYALGGRNNKTGKPNPTGIEGYYLGSRQVVSPKSKTGFAALHIFQTAQGNHGVWGKTNLDQKLRSVTPGTMTRVTFAGMQPTKNNPMYKYNVAIDTDNTIEVASGAAEEALGSSESSDDTGGYQQEAFGSDEDDVDAVADEVEPVRPQPPRRAAPPPAANVSKVHAALLGRKSVA